ncbi:MAG: hypothetical protein A3K90_03860 [Pelodictyon luteolum]|uniref:Uncharacterized protein n=2 Tax=Pelodictyon luteolum TaxID=1100 RepID=A0A165LT44_PELLU|nr:MAG: hypothetical protein A3K90_03860 [Pelodictyon luteolum]
MNRMKTGRMKTGLLVLFALVWAPIVLLALGSMLAPPVFALTGSHAAAGAASVISTGGIVYLFVRQLGQFSRKIGGGEA